MFMFYKTSKSKLNERSQDCRKIDNINIFRAKSKSIKV